MNIFNITTVRFKMVMIVNVLLCVFYRKKKINSAAKVFCSSTCEDSHCGEVSSPHPTWARSSLEWVGALPPCNPNLYLSVVLRAQNLPSHNSSDS